MDLDAIAVRAAGVSVGQVLVDVVRYEEPRPALIAFPPAGSGVGFLARWAKLLAPTMDFAVVRLPGREELWDEAPISDMDEILALVEADLARWQGRDVILYGACTGGLLAYELAHRLTARGRRPVALVVTNAPAPDVIAGERMHELPGPQLRKYYLDGDPEDYPDELWEMAEPRIRADLAAAEHTRYTMTPIDVPILAIRGADDTVLTRAHIERWARYTGSTFTLREVPGSHMVTVTGSDETARELAMLRWTDTSQ